MGELVIWYLVFLYLFINISIMHHMIPRICVNEPYTFDSASHTMGKFQPPIFLLHKLPIVKKAIPMLS